MKGFIKLVAGLFVGLVLLHMMFPEYMNWLPGFMQDASNWLRRGVYGLFHKV